MPSPFDRNPLTAPTPSWLAALLVLGGSVAGLVGVYWLLVHGINLIF